MDDFNDAFKKFKQFYNVEPGFQDGGRIGFAIGSPRLPTTPEQQELAQKLYGKNFKDLSTNQRSNIRTGKIKVDDITFKQYLKDYKGMANDPDYKPKYVKPNLGTGMSPQQSRAKAEARKNIKGFDSKFSKNVSRRKGIKLKAALEANPERKQIEMAKKAERRRGSRVAKLSDKKNLSFNEKLLNFEQSLITRQLNDKIKTNPNIILQNKELMDKLSITVDGDGNIIKSKPTIYELEKRGLFEIEHQRDVRKAGAMKDFPYNRNLILGPYNRSGGFKDMAEKFIEKNPNSNDPKVKNIIKKAKELKITLQPVVPKGTFKTKGIGYKQSASATGKFVDYAKSYLPELVDNKIGMSGYTGNKKMLEQGLKATRKTGVKLNAKIPGITELFEMAKSIPGDFKKKAYLKAGFKVLGIGVAPLVIYDTYKNYTQGKPILETLEQGIIGTDIIGGTKRFAALTPEEREARSAVKQDGLKDLNLDMPMGFGFIEGPDPMSDLTLEEAQAKATAGDERVKELEAQKNYERATNRSNFFGTMRDRALGTPQEIEFAGGGLAKLAGKRFGGPPESGPEEGLASLIKYDNKY